MLLCPLERILVYLMETVNALSVEKEKKWGSVLSFFPYHYYYSFMPLRCFPWRKKISKVNTWIKEKGFWWWSRRKLPKNIHQKIYWYAIILFLLPDPAEIQPHVTDRFSSLLTLWLCRIMHHWQRDRPGVKRGDVTGRSDQYSFFPVVWEAVYLLAKTQWLLAQHPRLYTTLHWLTYELIKCNDYLCSGFFIHVLGI